MKFLGKIVLATFVLSSVFAPSLHAQWLETSPSAGWVSAFAVNGENLFVGTNGSGGGVYRSTDNGASWDTVNSGLTFRTLVWTLVLSGNSLFAGTAGGIFRTTNNGASWIAVDSGLTDPDVGSFAVCPNGEGGEVIFAGTGTAGIFRSTNGGASWDAVNNGITNYSDVTAFVSKDTNLFVATDGGIWISSNKGTSWARTSFMPNAGFVHSLAVCGKNIFVGLQQGGVGVSTDNGASWQTASNGLPDPSYYNVWSLAACGNNLFAGTDSGVFLSTDGGVRWYNVNGGVEGGYIVSAVAVCGTNLLAGGWTVWRREVDDLVLSVHPASFKLEQNYPNPFNPLTTIRYQLPSQSFVHISIFNILGQEVRAIVNETEGAAYQSVLFNASNLSSGIYFYRITAGPFTDVKKMVLLK